MLLSVAHTPFSVSELRNIYHNNILKTHTLFSVFHTPSSVFDLNFYQALICARGHAEPPPTLASPAAHGEGGASLLTGKETGTEITYLVLEAATIRSTSDWLQMQQKGSQDSCECCEEDFRCHRGTRRVGDRRKPPGCREGTLQALALAFRWQLRELLSDRPPAGDV